VILTGYVHIFTEVNTTGQNSQPHHQSSHNDSQV
jgi:hypothetical protein